MKITTMCSSEGLKVKKVIGVVFGTSAQTRGIYGHLKAMAENLLGGRATAFTENMNKARFAAMEDITKNAEVMGANCIIRCEFEVLDVMNGYILVNATGTAVVIE